MKKVVICPRYTEFRLSDKAKEWMDNNVEGVDEWNYKMLEFGHCRDEDWLVDCFEALGREAMENSRVPYWIKKYDDENYYLKIVSGSYDLNNDFAEEMVLEPIVKQSKIENCKSVNEIMDYLEGLGIYTERN